MASVQIRAMQKCFGATADPALALGETECLDQSIIEQYISEGREPIHLKMVLRGLNR